MAYKRTTKSSKGPNGTSIRQTRTYNDKTGKLTVSTSQSNGTSRFTQNTNNDKFLTRNNHGWISRKKLNVKAKASTSKNRKKSARKNAASSWVGSVFLLVVVIYLLTFL